MPGCLPRQPVVHLVETLDCVCYAVGHFEMVAESAINREFRSFQLQRSVKPAKAPEQKELLT